MSLTENTDQNPAATAVEQKPDPSAVPVPVPADQPAVPETVKQPRNQHLRSDNPKIKQFSARCTQAQFEKIESAMKANKCVDIVDLMLYSIKLHENDVFSSFKT
jgi:hypothetical protein